MPLKSSEIELVWSINARLFYFGQRKWIFNVPIKDDLTDLISITIQHFIAGARVVLPQILSTPLPQRKRRNAQSNVAQLSNSLLSELGKTPVIALQRSR